MTTITIDIACNGEECGECENWSFASYSANRFCVLFGESIIEKKRCPACLAAEIKE